MTSAAEPPPPLLGPDARHASVWTSRARRVFAEVRHLEGAARREALDRACGGDWALHSEVAALFAHEAPPPTEVPPASASAAASRVAPRLERPAVEAPPAGDPPPRLAPPPLLVPPPPSPAPLTHDSIPGFRIVKLLGVGAAGAVYEAEQERPRRAVALKVFRAPSVDERLRQRIAHEAEILARLRHPSVAQVFAVHADTGELPWIAMELVHGTPIDAWCRERAPTLRARVELLATVAEAVGHAHACGVVHRDLKPLNVLVTESGVPKVVDFGVARTVGDAPVVGTLHTRDGDLVGTLAYMSVEQAEGATAQVDARTDVHALGVMAFELLAGRLPRDPEWMTLPEWAQALRRPPPSLRDVVPGAPTDLALVVGKALEPEREGRYPTAQAFADDLRRFLASEPVVARAPTTGYLLRSFVRRHRALVSGALATVLALVAGLVVSLNFAIESDAQRRRADRETVESRREAYRAQMSVASQALATANAFGARAALERTPAAMRGWEWDYLAGQLDRSIRTVSFAGRTNGWMEVSRDGGFVVGGGTGGGALVLDATTGAVVRAFPGTPRIEHGLFLGDGRRVALLREGGGLDVADVATGVVTRTFPPDAGRTTRCDAAAVGPDGVTVAESRVGAEPRLRFVNVDTGLVTRRTTPHQRQWTTLAYAPDGLRLLATQAEGVVETLRTEGDGPLETLGAHDAVPIAACFDPAGRRVASGGADRRAVLFDIEGGARRTEFLHQQSVSGIAWSDDGARIATWSAERMLRVFDAAGLRVLRETPALDVGERARVRFLDGGTKVEAIDEASRHVWFSTADAPLDVLRGHRTVAEGNRFPYVYDVAFSPDGRRIATAGWDGSVRIWSALTCALLAVLETTGPLQALAFSPDGRSIVAVGRPHHLTVFDADTGRRLAVVDDGRHDMDGGLAFARDGSTVLTPAEGGFVALRDPRTLARTRVIDAPGRPLSVAAGPDGAVLVGLTDGWRLFRPGERGGEVPLAPQRRFVIRVAFSPDGALVGSVSHDGIGRVADARTGATRCELTGHVGRVYALAFSRDGRRVATGGDDGTIRIHDTATGDELLVLRGHASYVFSLAFSPDGTTLASASGDNTARLWSLRPIADRVARRDAALAVETAVEPIVKAAIAKAPTPEAAVASLRERADLDADRRATALEVALRLLAPTTAPAAPSAPR